MPEFQRDLYRGAATFYDAFRPGYPDVLFDDLLARIGDCRERVLDFGCGTGQITFALADAFREVWAVDQEPDMLAFVAQKSAERAVNNVHCVVARAEDFGGAAESFDLVTFGNSFHRVARRDAAQNVKRFLRAGGLVALVWSDGPWTGEQAWQRMVAAAMGDWKEVLRTGDRVPVDWQDVIDREPHDEVLRGAGFAPVGRFEFPMLNQWTVSSLVGLARSSSVFSAAVDDAVAAEIEVDLAERLQRSGLAPPYRETTTVAYDLFQRARKGT